MHVEKIFKILSELATRDISQFKSVDDERVCLIIFKWNLSFDVSH